MGENMLIFLVSAFLLLSPLTMYLNNTYILIEEKCSSLYPIKSLLLYDQKLRKYNAYVIDNEFPGMNPMDCNFIVKTYCPVSVVIANDLFPKYKFTEENYGF